MRPAKFEPITPLDPEKPLQALSLPAWLQRCLNALTPDYFNPQIPAELALSKEQRAAIGARISALSQAEMACSVDHTMAVVVDLLEGFPTAKLTDDQARRKAKAYITALEDIPTWAVADAGQCWLKAKAGPQNYDFAPTPPRLRQIAEDALTDVRAQRIRLQRLLSATTEPVECEHSEESKKRVETMLSEFMKQKGKTKVMAGGPRQSGRGRSKGSS
jgi:hypothetical protein